MDVRNHYRVRIDITQYFHIVIIDT